MGPTKLAPRWGAVQAWLRDLAQAEVPDTGLSAEGAHAARAAALSALNAEALAQVAAMPVLGYAKATVVTARTVFTAPIEWCAVLLGRGSAVTLKYPAGAPGWAPQLAELARRHDLPLTVTDSRDAIRGADVVVAMASDKTIQQLRGQLHPTTRFLAHGHRFSVAWLTDLAHVDAVAYDLALYDSRGCMSPQVVFTPIAAREAGPALLDALERAQQRWPRGEVSGAEAATLRARLALAQVLGTVWRGEQCSVRALPAEHIKLGALPRAIQLVQVEDATRAAATLGEQARWLSTVGTDDPGAARAWQEAGASRICALGTMQQPPLRRAHDGVDWLRATGRLVSQDGL